MTDETKLINDVLYSLKVPPKQTRQNKKSMRRSEKIGGTMKVRKAGLGAIMLLNEVRKQGKKEGRRQAAEGQSQDKQYQEFLASKKSSEPKKAKTGDMVQLTDTFEGHDVKGGSIQGEYGTNSSMQNYYKDLLG